MFTDKMKILQAMVLLGTLAAFASTTATAKKTPPGFFWDLYGKDPKEILLEFLRSLAFNEYGGPQVQTLDYFRIVPGEAKIIVDITAIHGGLRYPTFPCSAVIYIRGPILPIAVFPPPLPFEFDPKHDLSCVKLRKVP